MCLRIRGLIMEREKRFTVILSLMLLSATVIASFTPVAAATAITSLNPNHGSIGTTVRVIGEIETANATYRIYFYNGTAQMLVKTGTASNLLVNATFTVPSAIGGSQDVTLHDVTAGTNATLPFTVEPTYYVSATPARIPGEGLNTTLTVGLHEGLANTTYNLLINVTDPANNSYTKLLPMMTDAFGAGENTTIYYGEFSGAHTNYTGTYSATVNQIFTNTTFSVGLTNATRYNRLQVVHVQGAGYLQPGEAAWVNITFAGEQSTPRT